jgi:Spy/CpxP family protein refolding chaperone
MKKWHIVALALLFVGLATISFAELRNPTPPIKPAGFQGQSDYPPAIGSYLNFSNEQKDRMRELRDRFSSDSRDLRYSILEKQLEVRKLFTDPKADSAALLAKQKELNVLKHKLMDMRAQMRIEWRGILTLDQISKLDRMPMRPGMNPGGM